MKLDALPIGSAVALTITLHPNGALSIEGPIDDMAFSLAMLDNARDAIRNHHAAQREIVVPSGDVALPSRLS